VATWLSRRGAAAHWLRREALDWEEGERIEPIG
jgi:hypothetical protein